MLYRYTGLRSVLELYNAIILIDVYLTSFIQQIFESLAKCVVDLFSCICTYI